MSKQQAAIGKFNSDYREKAARREGKVQLEGLQAALGRVQEEIGRYVANYEAASNDQDRAMYLNFAIHYATTNLMSGFRIDLLAKAQAELSKLGDDQ